MLRRSPTRRRPSLAAQVLAVNALLVCAAILASAVGDDVRIQDLASTQSQLLLTAAILASILVNGLVLRRRFAPLEELIATMERVDLAHPGVRATVGHADTEEVARLQQAFNRMLARVEEERATTSRAVLRGQEAERARIARDLHDEANQSLTGLLLRLQAAAHDAPPALAAELAETRELASRAMHELLRLARELRPAALDDHGLHEALHGQVDRFRTPGGARARLDLAPTVDLDALDPDEQLVVYRVVQESLSNVFRHARARHVTVEVTPGAAGPVVRVCDDGCGFAPRHADGTGLEGMRERARLVGGRLSVRSRPGAGTTVELALAVRAPTPIPIGAP
ncbi:HAMP domain-containing sensor histidine kinase [Paraconexibacter algicola]|nr:HAMP domain-containing sensor histidine kinase [Paraconexibacter algicola]